MKGNDVYVVGNLKEIHLQWKTCRISQSHYRACVAEYVDIDSRIKLHWS